jgi:hypothetical protein
MSALARVWTHWPTNGGETNDSFSPHQRPATVSRAIAAMGVRRDEAAISSGYKPHPAPRSGRKQPQRHEGDEMSEAFG